MLEDFKYFWNVRRLQKRRAKIWKEFAKKRTQRTDDGIVQWDDAYCIFDDNWIEEELMMLRSNYLRDVAQRYFLPVPEYDPKSGIDWKYTESGNFRAHLTLDAQRKLENEIRSEKIARSDRLLRWFPLILGLVGTITGLIAVCKK